MSPKKHYQSYRLVTDGQCISVMVGLVLLKNCILTKQQKEPKRSHWLNKWAFQVQWESHSEKLFVGGSWCWCTHQQQSHPWCDDDDDLTLRVSQQCRGDLLLSVYLSFHYDDTWPRYFFSCFILPSSYLRIGLVVVSCMPLEYDLLFCTTVYNTERKNKDILEWRE